MAVVYPSAQARMGERGKILYYIAGWTLSKTLTHVKRYRTFGETWCPLVDMHHCRSPERGPSFDETLCDLVGGVQRGSETENGSHLPFVTRTCHAFVQALDRGYGNAMRNTFVFTGISWRPVEQCPRGSVHRPSRLPLLG